MKITRRDVEKLIKDNNKKWCLLKKKSTLYNWCVREAFTTNIIATDDSLDVVYNKLKEVLEDDSKRSY